MAEMICSICHKYGIYWRGLGSSTVSVHTYCPHCGGINCQVVIEEEQPDIHEDFGDRD